MSERKNPGWIKFLKDPTTAINQRVNNHPDSLLNRLVRRSTPEIFDPVVLPDESFYGIFDTRDNLDLTDPAQLLLARKIALLNAVTSIDPTFREKTPEIHDANLEFYINQFDLIIKNAFYDKYYTLAKTDRRDIANFGLVDVARSNIPGEELTPDFDRMLTVLHIFYGFTDGISKSFNTDEIERKVKEAGYTKIDWYTISKIINYVPSMVSDYIQSDKGKEEWSTFKNKIAKK